MCQIASAGEHISSSAKTSACARSQWALGQMDVMVAVRDGDSRDQWQSGVIVDMSLQLGLRDPVPKVEQSAQ